MYCSLRVPVGKHQVVQPVGGRHVDGQVDAGPPGRRAEGLHHARAAQDADAAQHAQPRVGGLLGNFLAIGHGDAGPHAGIRRPAAFHQPFGHGLGHHPPGHPGNRRFSHFNPGAGSGYSAHAGAAGDLQPLVAVGQSPYTDDDFGAVGDVGVVARRP